ncbi:hypothetical protein BJ944DRAFT_258603 [Cunninghamella echinulata]|nr:hypothetical protein BJ944DRAFT_258603 [Cunninghamella echinulata]
MVSILWGSSAIDELIEKSTSEFVPSGQLDLGLQLEISDKIRSKKVNAKEAMQAMKKRLSHKNPNVQLATLSLVDTCVKNSGDSFVREIASREFLDDLVLLMKQPVTNIDVKNKILETIQTWGIAAKGNPSIAYMTGTYSLLRSEGYMFPTVQQKIDPILFETSSAPEWTDSDVCERCRTSFTITNRKHHCRNCGGTFCQDCSSRTIPLPHLAINESVRVCDGCHLKLKMSKVPGINNLPPLPSSTSHLDTANLPNQIHPQNNNNNNNSYDDDIKKAIELSLKEDEQRKKGYGSGYIPSNINKDDSQPISQLTNIDEEEDQELVAAIAASLRDMEVSSPPQVNYEYASRPSSNDLTPAEIENIQYFSTFITQLQSQSKTIPDDPETSKLIGQIGSLQPKIVKSLDDTIHKYRAFVELHDKINKAVQSFDHILEQRMSSYRNDSILTTHNSASTTPNNIPNYGYYQSQPTTISTPLQHHQHSQQLQQQQQQPYLMNPQYNNININSQPTMQHSNNEPSTSAPPPPSQQQHYQYQYQTYSQSIPQTHTQTPGPVNQQPNNDQPLIDLS